MLMKIQIVVKVGNLSLFSCRLVHSFSVILHIKAVFLKILEFEESCCLFLS